MAAQDPTVLAGRDIVIFSIYPEGSRVCCQISLEALRDHFGATDEESMAAAVRRGMDSIGPVAERLWRSTPLGEPIFLQSRHFGA